ncbi:ABC-2 type transport system ATP-binding protein [Evansella caseinilytica]|uniref:ABC-2 type transport system ATP-binding protein n=1 Tax=Evansella caseinilytica TaxID=1503961 RepID=A0A1H3Q659_9BACI|nr:ABC transporter ATP-binding protein [Evansella caseinilytica]SDZ08733.1 ABC-2 type transport system ATP-binding protein [Evansella caseinilytica]
MRAIETKQLKKMYGSVPVVNGLDLVVEKGEIFGLLGRDGAGKSTFINMLTGIVQQSSGTYSLLGVACPNAQVKKRIGVMPEYSALYSSMTAVEHLQYLSSLSGKPAGKQRCIDVLHSVALAAHAHKKSREFSFGMIKKLGIAQAIIHDPELIFLDEPTSGLDAESVLVIHQLIIEMQKRGKTIIMTSHNLDEVERLCTRIAIMKAGQIVRMGTMDELRAFYRQTVKVRIKHAPVPAAQREILYRWLKTAGTKLEIAECYTTIHLEEEKKIADILRAFHHCKTDVYRAEVAGPTLEEIFLDESE